MEEKLIELIRNNKILYNKSHGGYKNIITKEKKWEEIGIELNQPVEKVKKRWKTIRDRYYRILKEEKCSSTSGSGQKVPAAEKYKYYEQLSFLRECEQFNMSTVGNFNNTAEYFGNSDIIEFEEENSQVCEYSNLEKTCSSSTPQSNKKRAETEVHKEMLDAIRTFKERDDKPSPIMLFMQSVGLQVEAANLSSERLLHLQSRILNVVRDAVSGSNFESEVPYGV